MLQAVKAEIGDARCVGNAGDADDAAHPWSVSHASGYAREIYLSETLDAVLDDRVAQPQSNRATARRHRTDRLRGHTELLGQRRHRGRALRWACDNGSPVRLAEQQVDSRKAQGVSRKIDIHAETCLVVRATHRDLRQRHAEPPLRAIVRGAE